MSHQDLIRAERALSDIRSVLTEPYWGDAQAKAVELIERYFAGVEQPSS